MKDIIKTCSCRLTFREPKEGQGICPACVTRARSQQSDEVVRAAGTSEGARKGWAARFKGAMPNHKPHELEMYVNLRDGGDSHGDAMRTIEGERQMASYQQSRGANKASEEDDTDSIHASGNSEGAKKGWEHKPHHAAGMRTANEGGWVKDNPHKEGSEEHHDWEHGFIDAYHQSKNPPVAFKKVLQDAGHRPHADWSENDSKTYWSAVKDNPYHSEEDKRKAFSERKKDIQHERDHGTMRSSDAQNTEVIHCRSHSALGPVLAASKPWNAGERVEFMWMPAGVSTICAGFRKGSIELTVQCSEETAQAVQASLNEWRNDRPKQEPFGCIEHKEQEASFRIGASCGFKWGNDGVYLAAEPTTLGAQNVNGKVHRSWSPSFTTDADYASATERDGVLMFPEGARGSRSNPAKITGVDFCVGTLTNKPAFHSMSPVRAKDGKDADYNRTNGGNQATNEELAISFRNDVPDYTQAELLVYCNRIRKGGSHMEAVTEARATRNSGSTKANEKPTLESIFAKTLKATETANTIAESHGVTKLTAEDVYERFSVKAEAKKDEETPQGILAKIYARAGASR